MHHFKSPIFLQSLFAKPFYHLGFFNTYKAAIMCPVQCLCVQYVQLWLISDLVVTDLFMHLLPGVILLYSVTPFNSKGVLHEIIFTYQIKHVLCLPILKNLWQLANRGSYIVLFISSNQLHLITYKCSYIHNYVKYYSYVAMQLCVCYPCHLTMHLVTSFSVFCKTN